MTNLEKLCANIIAGKALQDNPELAEQILKEAGYNVEKIKAEQKAAKYFKAAAEYEEYLNSMWLESYDVRRDIQAETHEADEEALRELEEAEFDS